MGLIGTLTDLEPGTLADADVVDANLEAIRTVVNTYAVLTDVTRTISAAQTFSAGVTMSSGLTVSSGTTAVQALTCTTIAASSNATVGGTLGITGATTCAALTASGTVSLSASSCSWRFVESDRSSDEQKWEWLLNAKVLTLRALDASEGTPGNVWSIVRGTGSAITSLTVYPATTFSSTVACGALTVVTSGITVSSGTTAVQALTATTGTFSSTLGVTGAATFSSTINGQTLSSSSSLTGSLTVATTLGVTGASTLAALACTTIAASGLVTASAGVTIPTGQTLTLATTSTNLAIDFTGAAPQIRLASSGTLLFHGSSGASAVRLKLFDTGDVQITGTLATSATAGFLALPNMAGAPSGSATLVGSAVYDTTNKRLRIWNGSSFDTIQAT